MREGVVVDEEIEVGVDEKDDEEKRVDEKLEERVVEKENQANELPTSLSDIPPPS